MDGVERLSLRASWGLGVLFVVFLVERGIVHAKELDEVDERADAKESAGKEVEDAHSGLSEIEFVCSEAAEEEAEQHCG